MNPFRVILLVLLSLSLVMLFYIVAIYVPQHKQEYQQYQSLSYMADLQGKREEHEKRMSRIAPKGDDAPRSDLQAAQKEAREADAEQQRLLLEAEERRVIAEARVKEAQGAAPRVDMNEVGLGGSPMSTTSVSTALPPAAQLAVVVSYEHKWGILEIAPLKGKTMSAQEYTGKRIMIKRNDGLICEATIQSGDEKTGRIIADVIAHTLNPVADVKPQQGDKVYLSSLAPTSDPRVPVAAPAAAIPQGSAYPVYPTATPDKQLDEMEIPLVPTEV